MTTTSSREKRDVPPKATLFCPACGHRSRFDGDWYVEERARDTRYLCPDCDTEVLTRTTYPTPTDRGSARSPDAFWARTWRRWAANLRTWQGFWRDTVRAR